MKDLQSGQLRIGLPNDTELLKAMILWEGIYGDAKSLEKMKNKLKKLEAK